MTVLAGFAALAIATFGGYYFGRRAGATRSTWKKRSRRIALGKVAISLLALTVARRLRRGFAAEHVLPDAVSVWGLSIIAPLELLRGSVPRMRSC